MTVALTDGIDWQTLLPHLAGLTDAECRDLAPRLAHLPDETREVPGAWIDQALDGAPPAAMQLARSLHLTDHRYDDTEDDGAFERLLRHPSLAGLTRLTLGMTARRLTAAWLAELSGLKVLRIETTEAFTSALTDEQLTTIAAAPALGRVTLLSLERVHVRGPGVAALARSSTLTALTELELYAPAAASLCNALAVHPAPALRGVQRLALCADHFTNAAAAALARAVDLLTGLRALEFRIDESGGFDWSEPFSSSDGGRNTRRLAGALARLLPALHDCERVTIDYTPASQIVHLARADFERLADPRALRAAFPPRMANA